MKFTAYQKIIIGILAFLQFTIILDFMILSPLGALLMPTLNITADQFGLVVSVYAFSAGVSGILAAGFADRYDRKRLLLFFYGGFVLATLFCGLAPNYHFLLGARMMTGLFGGVIGSITMAIATDLFPLETRGRVMGFLQTAFAASQVLGIPAGLYLSNHWGWHMPFLMIVAISSAVGVLIMLVMKPIRGHLALQKKGDNPFRHIFQTVSKSNYLVAFVTTALLSTGGFMLMPFSSTFNVNNLKIPMESLPYIYLFTGLCSIFTGPIIGRMSEKVGYFRMFCFGSAVTTIMVIIYTHLTVTPLYMVVIVSAVMFIGIFSRMIPSSALMSAVPDPASRGAFMAVSSAVQQISGGVASLLAGYIVIARPNEPIERFDILGYVVVGATAFTVVMMYQIDRRLKKDPRILKKDVLR